MTHKAVAVGFACAALGAIPAQDLGGGAPASHGRVPRFVLESWIPGTASAVRIDDAPPPPAAAVAILATARGTQTIPGLGGVLIADPVNAIRLPFVGGRLPIGTLPPQVRGTIYGQAVWLEPAVGSGFTDAFRIDLFEPLVMTGSRDAFAGAPHVVDLVTRQTTPIGGAGGAGAGMPAFHPDGTQAWVTEPAQPFVSPVSIYDTTRTPIVAMAVLGGAFGIGQRGVFDPAGRRFYLPVISGIDVFDADPSSPTRYAALGRIDTPWSSPEDIAITPDGQRAIVAYSGTTNYPGQVAVTIIDLLLPGLPRRTVPISLGGVYAFLYFEKVATCVSPDGAFAYVLERGYPPAFGTSGFTNGGVLNVVDLATESEVAVLATGGLSQSEMAIDRLGRDLWIAQQDAAGYAELLRIDVDRRSATRNTIRSRIRLASSPAPPNSLSLGVDVTPDGGTVCVATPAGLVTVDARTERVFGAPIFAGAAQSVAIQQR
ncbi:MAG: hypothetical protein IPM29_30575 [Planctomycetes bacterium]|nr:hypothetical protein [Planctomycetota bacterium]